MLLSLALATPTQQYGSVYELYFGMGEGPAAVKPNQATASSSLSESNLTHGPSRVSDGNKSTVWCEGQEGTGVGASLTLQWEQPINVYAIEIWGGYFLDERRLFSNERLQTYRILFNGTKHLEVTTADVVKGTLEQSLEYGNMLNFDPALDGATPPPPVTSMTIEVVSVYPGEKYTDLCISEIIVYQPPS